MTSTGNAFGFSYHLTQHGQNHMRIFREQADDNERSPPACSGDRVVAGENTWVLNSCVSTYNDFPLVDYAMTATTLTRSHEAIHLAITLWGFRMASVRPIVERIISGVHFSEDAP